MLMWTKTYKYSAIDNYENGNMCGNVFDADEMCRIIDLMKLFNAVETQWDRNRELN